MESRRLLSAGFIFGTSAYAPRGGAATISTYLPSGQNLFDQQISARTPGNILISNSKLFVLNTQLTGFDASGPGYVSEYNLDTTAVNETLISGLVLPNAMAIGGSDIFITLSNGTVAEYTTSGAMVNASLISGLDNPSAIVVSGNNLFIQSGASTQAIGEYTLTGAPVNASLISGVAISTIDDNLGLVAVGQNLFISTSTGVAEYTTSGALVNAAFSSIAPYGLASSGGELFVADISNVYEYATSGTLLNTYDLGLNSTYGVFAVAPAAAPAASPLHADFIVQPTAGYLTNALGLNQQTTVCVEDQNGNLASGVTGTVTLSISDGPAGAALLGTTTLPLVDGSAEFSDVTVSEPGTYVLTASSNIADSGTSDSVNIPTLNRYLSLAAQSTEYATASKTILPAISVNINDQDGNIVTTATNSISLAETAGNTSLASGTTVAAVNGVANFSDVLLQGAGTISIQASDQTDTAVDFSVVPAIPSLYLATLSPAVGVNQPVTFIATVPELIPGVTPTGTVRFTDAAGNLYGESTLQGNGTTALASFTTRFIHPGSFTINANYSGDSVYLPSASAALSGSTDTTVSTGTVSFGNVVLPESVIGGVKIKSQVPVIISNDGAALKGRFTVNLYAQPTNGADGNLLLLKSVTKLLSLKSNQQREILVPVTDFPATLAAGNYQLVAEMIDPGGSVAAATSSNTVSLAVPVVMPAVNMISATPEILRLGQASEVDIFVSNHGNVLAKGITVDLTLVGLNSPAKLITVAHFSNASIAPGDHIGLRIRYRVPRSLRVDEYILQTEVVASGAAVSISTIYILIVQ